MEAMKKDQFDFGPLGRLTCAIEFKDQIFFAHAFSSVSYERMTGAGITPTDAAYDLLCKLQIDHKGVEV